MDWYRILHTMGMYLCSTAVKRAEYLKRHNILFRVGDNCMTMFRKVPLYPKLISFGNNVKVASGVRFINHDIFGDVLLYKNNMNYHIRRVGKITIGNNVLIGSNSMIMYDVTVGNNVIIAAGSCVTKDVPNNTIVAGVPAKVIGSFEAYEKKFIEITKNYPWLGTKDKTVVAGIALESVDGGLLENVIISDIVMRSVQTPIFVRLGDRKRTFSNRMSRINDVMISRIIARSESKVACSVTGVPGGNIQNLTIKKFVMTNI